MMKLIAILIIILFGYLLYKIRIGYVLIVVYLLSFVVNPLHEITEQFFQQHEFLKKVYGVYLPYILLVFLLFNVGTRILDKKKRNLISQPNKMETTVPTEPMREEPVQKVSANDSFVNNLDAELKAEKYEAIDNSFINLIDLKPSFWDSDGEEKVYNVLKGFINNKYYAISPHIGLREMLLWDWNCFNSYENFRVSSMHFDFVIHDKSQWINCPALVIEVWGKDHYDESRPWIKRTDYFKKSILKSCEIPFIIIDLSESIPDDKIRELVMHSIKKEVPSREFYNVYCPKCKKIMKIKLNQKAHVLYYGCRKWPNCDGNRSISDVSKQDNAVQPLYQGIPIRYEK